VVLTIFVWPHTAGAGSSTRSPACPRAWSTASTWSPGRGTS
jgi:hypothetical protein